MEYGTALKSFFSEFLPAFTLESVPDEVTLPYITFPMNEPRWNSQGNTYCQIWYPKEHLVELTETADQIMGAIGDGVKLEIDGGYVMLYLADMQAQILTDTSTQSAYISLLVNAYHKPGV